MTRLLVIVGVATVGALLKAVGLLRRTDGPPQHPGWRRVASLLTPALLAGLVMVSVHGRGTAFIDPALLAGAAAAVSTRLLRAPLLLALIVGVITTAAVRLLL